MHKFCFLTWRESKEASHSALPPSSPSFIVLLRTKCFVINCNIIFLFNCRRVESSQFLSSVSSTQYTTFSGIFRVCCDLLCITLVSEDISDAGITVRTDMLTVEAAEYFVSFLTFRAFQVLPSSTQLSIRALMSVMHTSEACLALASILPRTPPRAISTCMGSAEEQVVQPTKTAPATYVTGGCSHRPEQL